MRVGPLSASGFSRIFLPKISWKFQILRSVKLLRTIIEKASLINVVAFAGTCSEIARRTQGERAVPSGATRAYCKRSPRDERTACRRDIQAVTRVSVSLGIETVLSCASLELVSLGFTLWFRLNAQCRGVEAMIDTAWDHIIAFESRVERQEKICYKVHAGGKYLCT